jgi:phospholipid/cholesterol/gamma-HCH transport system permease protein
MKYIEDIGSYFLMLKKVFSSPTKTSVLKGLIFKEIDDLIIGSIPIVAFISFFVGGVVAIQTALNIDNPLIPEYLIGFATRQSIILEFAPTFISIIMAGKVGSFITSSIGSMLLYPFVIAIAMFLGIFGGWIAGVYGGFTSSDAFIQGLQQDFIPFHIIYAFIKTFVFALILATVPSWQGYYMKGGALEVGKASTNSFVWTSVLIILANYIITQLLLS